MKKLLGKISCFGLCFFTLGAFGLSLEQVVQQSLESNPQIRAAKEQVLARQAEVKGAKSSYRPTIDAELGIGREWTRSPATNDDTVALNRKEAALRLRQPLYNGGATAREVDRQQARVDSALFNLQAVEANVALRTVEVYLGVMRQSELLVLLRDSLDTHQNIYDQVKLRADAGLGSTADLDQIGARLALAKNNYAVADNNLKDAVTNFYRVVGYVPENDIFQMPQLPEVNESLEALMTKAYEQHPQLLSANADVLAAEAQYKASKSGNYPRLSLEADKTWNDDIDGVEGLNEDLVIALRMRYRLYNGGANTSRKKQTASELEEAKAIRDNAKRLVEESLRLSWTAWETTSLQAGLLDNYVKTVADTRDAYEKQFSLNKRTFLDLLNTQNELLEARQNQLNATYDQKVAAYRVKHGKGELLNVLAEK